MVQNATYLTGFGGGISTRLSELLLAIRDAYIPPRNRSVPASVWAQYSADLLVSKIFATRIPRDFANYLCLLASNINNAFDHCIFAIRFAFFYKFGLEYLYPRLEVLASDICRELVPGGISSGPTTAKWNGKLGEPYPFLGQSVLVYFFGYPGRSTQQYTLCCNHWRSLETDS
jgi:hypothetical protein